MLIYMSMIESGEDEDLFKGLYLKYRKHMKYIAMQILGDEYLAEDAVHNAFLKIIPHLERFHKFDCQETKNLIVIFIRSTSIDLYRKRKREFEQIDTLDQDIPTEADFSALNVADILSAIKTLPEIYRDVLLLKVEYEYTDREIAKILGIKTDTVSKRLERARKQLKKLLGEVESNA